MTLQLLSLVFIHMFTFAQNIPYFHSPTGDEYEVQFQSDFQTEIQSLDDLSSLNTYQRQQIVNQWVHPTVKYVYGPMTHREWGGIQRNVQISMLWNKAYVKNKLVYIPYIYQGTWILHNDFLKLQNKSIPVPITAGVLDTPNWHKCTETHGQYPDMSIFWYYWDPSRIGCDHKLGVQYQLVPVNFRKTTVNEKLSYPEYTRLIRNQPNGDKELRMTIAFGYAEESPHPNPDIDQEVGAREYRKLISYMREQRTQHFQEQPIFAREYDSSNPSVIPMGYRYITIRNGIRHIIQIVINSEVDQMDLFAKSFAQDHDSFFAWFGHSRIGLGFDADRMKDYLTNQPNKYQISPMYQIVYWAGCNSYSYYTLPFFQMKANSFDPLGIRNLDIISNGLPSYFSLNAAKAKIMLRYLLNWKNPSSYQQILFDLEREAARNGFDHILINVMGDEDNPKID